MKTFLLGFLFAVITSPALADLNDGELLDSYHQIQTSLAHDAYPETRNLAGEAITPLNHWLKEAPMDHNQRPDVMHMLEGASKLALTEVESEQRGAFGPLSKGVVDFIRKDSALQASYQLFFCPMVTGYAYWVQPKGEKIANPYMGMKMLACGSKKPW